MGLTHKHHWGPHLESWLHAMCEKNIGPRKYDASL